MKLPSLNAWLSWVKTQHIKEIDLSLERVQEMALRLNLLKPTHVVVTVAGTNGKGSTVAGLEAIYLAGGYRVGAFTSPYLFQYNEQIRIHGVAVADDVLCDAFERITQAAHSFRLTQFELGTLAALLIFAESNLDLAILEVGLGGRFDAVNVMDADIAIITSIGIDHVEWLGNTREAIAREKAGIMRPHAPAICGDLEPPITLVDYADQIMAPLFCQDKEFGFIEKDHCWDWWRSDLILHDLPLPALALQNMSSVLMAVDLLQKRLPVSRDAIHKALSEVFLPGRIQAIPGDICHIFDVSHNPASVEWLADFLQKNPIDGQTHAVFSMLADKDIVSSIQAIQKCINFWYSGALSVERAAPVELLGSCFRKAGVNEVNFYESISSAYQAAFKKALVGDRIVVFGSFHTVASVSKGAYG